MSSCPSISDCTQFHHNCCKIAKYLEKKTSPQPDFDFNRFLQSLHDNCLDNKRVVQLVLKYSLHTKINVTKRVVLNVLMMLKIDDFKTVLQNQLNKFNNNIAKILICEKSFIVFFESYTSPPKHDEYIQYCLNATPINQCLKMFSLSRAQWNKLCNASFILNFVLKNIDLIRVDDIFNVINITDFDVDVIKHFVTSNALFKQENSNTLIGKMLYFRFFDKIENVLTQCNIRVTNEVILKYPEWIALAQSKLTPTINILITHGLVMTKEIIILILERKNADAQPIINPSLYGIELDDDIMLCAYQHKYFDYDYNKMPSENLLIALCANMRDCNAHLLEKYKNLGGIFTQKCLDAGCVNGSYLAIKFLVEKCNLKITDECLKSYNRLNVDENELLLGSNYEPSAESNINIDLTEYDEEKSNLQLATLNATCLTTITKCLKSYNHMDICAINSNIKKILKCNDKPTNYGNVFATVLKYFIDNNYVIGQYFIIGGEFAKVVGIESGSICHIDEMHKMVEYLIV